MADPAPNEPAETLAPESSPPERRSPLAAAWAKVSSPVSIAILFGVTLAIGLAVKFLVPPADAETTAGALDPAAVPGDADIVPAPDASAGPLAALLEPIAFVCGLVLLVVGADYMVRGAVRLARGFGVSPFLVGVTVVAFGTSAPELVASIVATLSDRGEIAVGNVIGSNIANLCLILGVTALIRPIAVNTSVVKVDLPLMIAITILAPITMLDQWILPATTGSQPGASIGRIDGAILTAGLAAYIVYNIIAGKLDPAEIEQDFENEPEPSKKNLDSPAEKPSVAAGLRGLPMNLLFIVAGLVGLVLGGDLLVDGSVRIAGRLGVSPIVIGLTIVAIGTSLPELALSVRAALHGHSDIAVGNVIGSNVFNLLCVLGIASLVDPIRVPDEAIPRDILWMLGVTIAVWPLFWSRRSLNRTEGGVLLSLFVVYIAFVFFVQS